MQPSTRELDAELSADFGIDFSEHLEGLRDALAACIDAARHARARRTCPHLPGVDGPPAGRAPRDGPPLGDRGGPWRAHRAVDAGRAGVEDPITLAARRRPEARRGAGLGARRPRGAGVPERRAAGRAGSGRAGSVTRPPIHAVDALAASLGRPAARGRHLDQPRDRARRHRRAPHRLRHPQELEAAAETPTSIVVRPRDAEMAVDGPSVSPGAGGHRAPRLRRRRRAARARRWRSTWPSGTAATRSTPRGSTSGGARPASPGADAPEVLVPRERGRPLAPELRDTTRRGGAERPTATSSARRPTAPRSGPPSLRASRRGRGVRRGVRGGHRAAVRLGRAAGPQGRLRRRPPGARPHRRLARSDSATCRAAPRPAGRASSGSPGGATTRRGRRTRRPPTTPPGSSAMRRGWPVTGGDHSAVDDGAGRPSAAARCASYLRGWRCPTRAGRCWSRRSPTPRRCAVEVHNA